jgi:hypothetical protein
MVSLQPATRPSGAVLAFLVPAVALGKASLKVSPSSVAPGGVLTMSGSAGKLNSCKKGKSITFESIAFPGGSLPITFGKVTTKAKKHGKFSPVKVTIPATVKAGMYIVRGHCGKPSPEHFATTLFTVT